MKIITKRSIISAVADKYRAQFLGVKMYEERTAYDLKRLNDLELETCTEDDIKKIIGNSSWTTNYCSECRGDFEKTVSIGRYDYGESIMLCEACIEKALKLIRSQEI